MENISKIANLITDFTAEDREVVIKFIERLVRAGYRIHQGECKGFLEKSIEMDFEGSYKGSLIPRAGCYGDSWNH